MTPGQNPDPDDTSAELDPDPDLEPDLEPDLAADLDADLAADLDADLDVDLEVDPVTGELRAVRQLDDEARLPGEVTDVVTEDVSEEVVELYYGSVDEFVRDVVVPTFRRRTGDRGSAKRWAADWWRYPEAVIRLEAMWRSWEHLRLDPNTGLSTWLREHADYHLSILFAPDGPFADSEHSSASTDPLPYATPPEGLFPDIRTPADHINSEEI